MSDTENTSVAQKFLDKKLRLGKEIDTAQGVARAALQLACELGTADEIFKLATSIKNIDEAWCINQEQVNDLSGIVANQSNGLHQGLTEDQINGLKKFVEANNL